MKTQKPTIFGVRLVYKIICDEAILRSYPNYFNALTATSLK